MAEPKASTNDTEEEARYRSGVTSRTNINETQGTPTFVNGVKVRMKNPESGSYDWNMRVVSAVYNEDRPGWDYTVKDAAGILYSGPVEETRLRAG